MPFDKRDSNWLRLPKVGQRYDFSQHGMITEIKKVEGKGYNFITKEKVTRPDGTEVEANVDSGYHYVMTFEDGRKLSISSWAPYYAMDRANIEEGMKFNCNHPEEGKWEIEVIDGNKEINLEEELPNG